MQLRPSVSLLKGLTEFSKMVGTDVVGRPGGAVSLAVGMASILSSLPGMNGTDALLV